MQARASSSLGSARTHNPRLRSLVVRSGGEGQSSSSSSRAAEADQPPPQQQHSSRRCATTSPPLPLFPRRHLALAADLWLHLPLCHPLRLLVCGSHTNRQPSPLRLRFIVPPPSSASHLRPARPIQSRHGVPSQPSRVLRLRQARTRGRRLLVHRAPLLQLRREFPDRRGLSE